MPLARAALALTALSVAMPVRAAPVVVAVDGVRSAAGTVTVAICREAEFLKACRIEASAQAVPGTTIVTVPDVPPGRWAALAYHDRNGNGRADRNLIGLPTEDIGFSNGALHGLHKPRFDEAAFVHGPTPQRIAFTLRHF